MALTRRTVMMTPLLCAASAALPAEAQPLAGERHGLAYFDDPQMPEGFTHFSYVNPDAPKGGMLSYVPGSWGYNQNPETFNSFNTLILRGDAPPGVDRIFASLMAASADEAGAMYGYVAIGVAKSENGKVLRFRLRPEARFHDDSPITAEDVAWTFKTLKDKGHPSFRLILAEMVTVEAESEHVLKVTLSNKATRQLPLTIAGLPILSQRYYESRDFSATTLEPPLGSSAYRIARFEPGRFVEYERVKGWWGEKLPVNVGTDNFDIIRTEFYRDRDVAFEGFKGRAYLFREEFTARTWATQYDFPAARDGHIVKEAIATGTPASFQGFYINTRRDKFKDRRLREALILALDFEWINRNVMFGANSRTTSFFENSQMKAEGPPSAAELALLEPFRGKVPDEVFAEPFVPPVSDGSGQDRALLRRATQLLREAGFVLRDSRLLDPNGQPMSIEILMQDNSLERHLAPFLANLKRLGIEAAIRRVDSAQYQARLKDYDFDMMSAAFFTPLTPGESMKLMYGSQSVNSAGGRNYAGISDPAIDAMVEKLSHAASREEVDVAARALDRLLRAGRYIIPSWHRRERLYASWDVFERPQQKPRYGTGAPDTWWFNAEKAAKIGL